MYAYLCFFDPLEEVSLGAKRWSMEMGRPARLLGWYHILKYREESIWLRALIQKIKALFCFECYVKNEKILFEVELLDYK